MKRVTSKSDARRPDRTTGRSPRPTGSGWTCSRRRVKAGCVYREPPDFELPRPANGGRDLWRRWVDTALDSPHDAVPREAAPTVTGNTYTEEPCLRHRSG